MYSLWLVGSFTFSLYNSPLVQSDNLAGTVRGQTLTVYVPFTERFEAMVVVVLLTFLAAFQHFIGVWEKIALKLLLLKIIVEGRFKS